ncbi:hypothetical protein FKW77_008877 [Venturia effusa]|uniref:TLC domain-containing protein n=1 Tax=Venturia effusa TaxID=50376 RepID=A0A517LBI3_9PEZI|nr:hypothetical protein FKW77_008877 [Venturia effusa]
MSTLFALSLLVSTTALPIGNGTTIAPPWVSTPNVRGTADIVFTCLATISLCVYTALHLNVPKQGSTAVDELLRKAKWVAVGIFAPEVVVYSAFVQLRTVIVFRNSMQKILQKVDIEAANESATSPTKKKDETEAIKEMDAQHSDPLMKYMVKGHSTPSREAIFPDKQVSWTYAWYVIMGGFILDVSPLHDNYGVMTLSHHAVLALAKDRLFPPMLDHSIHDKSKADYLAKALVFFQVSFLLVQTIARRVQALPISLLEIHTLVHVVCAVCMYVAWLGKPLDIKDPTDITHIVWSNPDVKTGLHWQKSIAELLVQDPLITTWVCLEDNPLGCTPNSMEAETSLAVNYGPFSECHNRTMEPILASSKPRVEAQLLDSDFDGLFLKYCTNDLASAVAALPKEDADEGEEQNAWLRKTAGTIAWESHRFKEYHAVTSNGTKLPVALSLLSGCTLSSGVGPAAGYNPFCSKVFPDGTTFARLHFTQKALKRWLLAFGDGDCRDCVLSLHTATQAKPYNLEEYRVVEHIPPYFEKRMSSFVAKSAHHDKWTALMACVTCVAYGGIHAAGWNSVFATQAEQLLWRISCPLLVILGVPMYSFISALEEKTGVNFLGKLFWTWIRMRWGLRFDFDWPFGPALLHLVSFLGFIPYCAARVFLVVEAFISLRHVPEGVYQGVEWTNYIPHL